MTEGVGSRVGPGAGYGSGDPEPDTDPHQNVTDPPTLPVMLHTTGKIKVVPQNDGTPHTALRSWPLICSLM